MFNKFNKSFNTFLNNPTVDTISSLFFVLYASLVAPRLPKNIAILFNNYFIRLIILIIIVFVSKNNISLSIIILISLLVSLQTASNYNTDNIIINTIQNKSLISETETISSNTNVTNYSIN